MKIKEFLASRTSKTVKDPIDKAFMRSLLLSVFCIISCIVALATTTWAWFSDNVTSSEKIQTATYELTVESATATPISSDGGTKVYELSANTEYVFTFTASGSARTGYVVITVDGNKYYTCQINTSTAPTSVSVTLKFTEDKTVSFSDRWGTYHVSNETRDVYDGDVLEDMIKIN